MTERNKPTPLPYTSQSQIPASASSGNVPAAPSPTYHSQQPLLIRAQPPRIYEYSPQQGAEGDLLTISLTSEQPVLPLKIGFGSFIADTKQLHQPTYTTLTARVPAFSLTRCHELGVPLSIIAWSGDNEATDSWLVGYFIYNLDDQGHGQRKRGADVSEDYEKAYKRLSGGSGTGSSTSRTDDATTSVAAYMTGNTSNYSNTNQFYNIAPAPGGSSAYDSGGFRADDAARNFFPEAGQIMGVGYPYRPPPPSQVAPPTATSQSMSNPSYEYSHPRTADMVASASGIPPGGNIAMANAPYGISQTSPSFIAQPLQHETSLSSQYGEHRTNVAISPQDRSNARTHPQAPPAEVHSDFNPYAQLLNKANLIIDGDLDSMAANWAEEEWSNRRRLVQFWRRQENNEIICTFAPVLPADLQKHSIVVSCIYWQEQQECFITSVDTIYLLESLIGVKFTVEEKNRIRRNLEGFRPLTVSKHKPDSADFFKLVMSFPNPKPRNIEKDVKAFHWKTLPLALRKIIGKYTASYSSTASVNLDALQSAYPGADSSQHSPPQPSSATASTSNPESQQTSAPQEQSEMSGQPQQQFQPIFASESIQGFDESNL